MHKKAITISRRATLSLSYSRSSTFRRTELREQNPCSAGPDIRVSGNPPDIRTDDGCQPNIRRAQNLIIFNPPDIRRICTGRNMSFACWISWVMGQVMDHMINALLRLLSLSNEVSNWAQKVEHNSLV